MKLSELEEIDYSSSVLYFGGMLTFLERLVSKYPLGILTYLCFNQIFLLTLDFENVKHKKDFEQEMRILTRLDHPNIVKLLAIHRTEDDCAYIIKFRLYLYTYDCNRKSDINLLSS